MSDKIIFKGNHWQCKQDRTKNFFFDRSIFISRALESKAKNRTFFKGITPITSQSRRVESQVI